ncbi:hypothetical protein NHQ30_005159 [Ciborinia camelliae]|nr:hypothetical protein NHQ30_005159 [Ciborinia camelliae]
MAIHGWFVDLIDLSTPRHVRMKQTIDFTYFTLTNPMRDDEDEVLLHLFSYHQYEGAAQYRKPHSVCSTGSTSSVTNTEAEHDIAGLILFALEVAPLQLPVPFSYHQYRSGTRYRGPHSVCSRGSTSSVTSTLQLPPIQKRNTISRASFFNVTVPFPEDEDDEGVIVNDEQHIIFQVEFEEVRVAQERGGEKEEEEEEEEEKEHSYEV